MSDWKDYFYKKNCKYILKIKFTDFTGEQILFFKTREEALEAKRSSPKIFFNKYHLSSPNIKNISICLNSSKYFSRPFDSLFIN